MFLLVWPGEHLKNAIWLWFGNGDDDGADLDGNGGGGGPVKHDIEVNQASEFHQIVEDTE